MKECQLEALVINWKLLFLRTIYLRRQVSSCKAFLYVHQARSRQSTRKVFSNFAKFFQSNLVGGVGQLGPKYLLNFFTFKSRPFILCNGNFSLECV